MTWYLGITTTRLIAPQPGADKVRGEFAVEAQLRAMGLEAWTPRKIEFKRQGKQRYAEPVTLPYLPGYVFARIPAQDYARSITGTTGLSRTTMPLSGASMASVEAFRRRVEAEQAEAERIIARNDRAAMSAFVPGEALEILAGPFMDRAVSFRRMVENAAGWPEIEGEAQIFGQAVRVRVDPLDVRRAP